MTETELKTLKDLELYKVDNLILNHNQVKVVTLRDLKQEAIKWLRYYSKKLKQPEGASVWKTFFNITEEDLKGAVFSPLTKEGGK